MSAEEIELESLVEVSTMTEDQEPSQDDQASSDEDQAPTAKGSVLLSFLKSGRRKYKVFYHKEELVWEATKPPSKQSKVLIENVIAVKVVAGRSRANNEPGQVALGFVVHYAVRSQDKTWKYCQITFRHKDPNNVNSWVKTLQSDLLLFTQRPKRLLLFVNPFGGKKQAMKIYETFAKPLFALAGIEVTLTVSQRKDQIRDIVVNYNLDLFDSVGCVGGDGTVSELFNGLVLRECRMQDVNPDNINQDLPKPSLPIGIIPGGSTDTIAYCLHGTTDVTTAVLQIIFGDHLGLDLVSVHDENRMLHLYASTLSYGFLGDVAHDSDRYRWMGPKRYEFSGFRKFLRNKGYRGELAMYSDIENDYRNSKCLENCDACTSSCDANANVEVEWRRIQGKFFMISGANISCACTRSPNGIAPYSHLGDGNVHLVVVRHTSMLNNLRLLLRISSKNQDFESLPFVEVYRAREFCFRAIEDRSLWNCDGEVEHNTDIRAKVRRQLLTVFSRGIPRIEEKKSVGCCSCGRRRR